MPPLGIAYIGAVLENNGHSVKLIDAQIFNYQDKDILEICLNFKPSIIGISTNSATSSSAYHLAQTLKSNLPDSKIIIGGAHPSCYPEMVTKEANAADVIVIGEGEYIMKDIVEHYENNKSLSDINGIIYRDIENKFITNPPSTDIIDVEKLPFPAYHHFPMNLYAPEPFDNKILPSTSYITSRGCSYSKCTFCHRAGRLKRPYRNKSPQKVFNEIKLLMADFGIKEIVFFDDEIISNHRWIYDFCDLLLRNKLNLFWTARARVDSVNIELLRLMHKSGCHTIEYGFESGNQSLLDGIKKGITLEQCLNAARWTHLAGINIVGTFMIALPGENPELGRETIKFAKQLDCDFAAFTATHPFLGTPLYDSCLKESKEIIQPYTSAFVSPRFIPLVTYVPEGYQTKKSVELIVKKAYMSFYLRPKYILKHIRKIKSFNDFKRYWNGLKFFINMKKFFDKYL